MEIAAELCQGTNNPIGGGASRHCEAFQSDWIIDHSSLPSHAQSLCDTGQLLSVMCDDMTFVSDLFNALI